MRLIEAAHNCSPSTGCYEHGCQKQVDPGRGPATHTRPGHRRLKWPILAAGDGLGKAGMAVDAAQTKRAGACGPNQAAALSTSPTPEAYTRGKGGGAQHATARPHLQTGLATWLTQATAGAATVAGALCAPTLSECFRHKGSGCAGPRWALLLGG